MHEELSGAGARIIRNWTIVWFVVVVAIGAGYSLLATVGGGITVMAIGLVIGAVVGAASAVYLLVRGEHHAIKAAFPKAPSQYDAELSGRAEKFANALGIAPPPVYRFESEGPNVAALPWADGNALMVSSAAQYGLRASELDSLLALQLSLLQDPKAQRGRRSVVASNLVLGPARAQPPPHRLTQRRPGADQGVARAGRSLLGGTGSQAHLIEHVGQQP